MRKKGLLVVISGPSGSGKDSIVDYMLKKSPGMKRSVSATTRAPRENEQDGVDYYFLDKEEFKSRIDNGEMLEYTNYVGNYYGTPKKEVEQRLENGEVVLLVIEVDGGMQIKRMMREDSLLLFIHAPSMEELRSRLENRGTDSREAIESRLKRALEEMQFSRDYDHSVVNETIESCAEELLDYIDKTINRLNV